MKAAFRVEGIAAAFLLAIFIIGAASPGAFTWGFGMIGFLPAWTILLVCFLVLIAFATAAIPRISQFTERLIDGMAGRTAFFAAGAIAVTVAASVLLRVRAPLFGDGFFLVRNFSEAIHGIAPVYYRNEPLATAYFWGGMHVVGFPATYSGFLTTFLGSEIVLLIVFGATVTILLHQLPLSPKGRTAGLLLILAMPFMQLFFGYVETYAASLTMLGIYSLVTILWLRDRAPFWIVAIAFLGLVLTHYLMLGLLPAFVDSIRAEYKRRGWQTISIGLGSALGILFLLFAAAGFDLDKFSTSVPHHHYLPLIPSSDPEEAVTEPYTLFSPFHFVDIANYLIIGGLPFLLLLARPFQPLREYFGDPLKRFFFLSFLPFPLILFLLKFDLGAARDWDVLSPFFFPAAISALLFLEGEQARRVVTFALLLGTFSLTLWCVNADADASLARFQSLIDPKFVSPSSDYGAHLTLAQYYHQIHEDARTIPLWREYRDRYPSDPRGHQNLLNNFEKEQPVPVDSLRDVYRFWLASIPGDTAATRGYRVLCLEQGNGAFERGDYAVAVRWFGDAVDADSTDAGARNNLGSAYAQLGDRFRAERHFRAAVGLAPSYIAAWKNLGTLQQELGRHSEAQRSFRVADSLERIQPTGNIPAGN